MPKNPLQIGDSHAYCEGCPGIFPFDQLNKKGYCQDCWASKSHQIAERRFVSEQKGLTEATKKLADEIAARGKNSAISPEFFESFSKKLGGAKGLGERLADDFCRLHGDGLDADAASYFTRDEKTIQRYWQTISQFMQNQDRMNAVDISSLSDKELQSTLLGLATSLMEENDEFRAHVVKLACKNNLDLIRELALESGLDKTVDGAVTASKDDDALDIEDI